MASQNPMVDELNPQKLSEWLAGMSLPEGARALNRIAHYLTICTREFEAATQPFKDPSIVIKELIGLSELQLQLSAYIGHYLDAEEIKVDPMDVFAQILFEKATYYQIASQAYSSSLGYETGLGDGDITKGRIK